MTIPDTVPVIEVNEMVTYLKEKRDFFSRDGKFSGLNSEYAYVVRYEDIAICIVCVHGQLYVRKEPREEWGASIMLAVLMAYGMGHISPENTVPCSDRAMVIACMAHGVQDDASQVIEKDINEFADRFMRKPTE